MAKNLILGLTLPPNSGPQFFFKNLALPVIRYHGQLSSSTISEKNNDLILRKFSDGRTNGQTDESDFIRHCPTNIKPSKKYSFKD